jgi:Cu+-exporting ATPase
MMIGDGINDILSLSEADFGISFNANSQLNLIASDIIFIKNDLNLVPKLLKLSKYTHILLWTNIFWAFAYNLFMIPITAGVFHHFWSFEMSPTVSSLSMLSSSLLIILTSNLLRLVNLDYQNAYVKDFFSKANNPDEKDIGMSTIYNDKKCRDVPISSVVSV